MDPEEEREFLAEAKKQLDSYKDAKPHASSLTNTTSILLALLIGGACGFVAGFIIAIIIFGVFN